MILDEKTERKVYVNHEDFVSQYIQPPRHGTDFFCLFFVNIYIYKRSVLRRQIRDTRSKYKKVGVLPIRRV